MDDTPLERYVDGLFGGEDPLLRQMREDAAAEGVPSIQVPPDLGRLLQAMVVASRATRILEFGTLFGYSSILMARVLPPEGKIVTLEYSEKHAGIARRNFERAGVAEKVEVRVGKGVDLLPGLHGQQFDLVFIDADKASYPAYLQGALRLTRPGSVILADNVWRHGSILDAADEDSRGIVAFNQEVTHNPHLITTFVPRLSDKDAAALSVVR